MAQRQDCDIPNEEALDAFLSQVLRSLRNSPSCRSFASRDPRAVTAGLTTSVAAAPRHLVIARLLYETLFEAPVASGAGCGLKAEELAALFLSEESQRDTLDTLLLLCSSSTVAPQVPAAVAKLERLLPETKSYFQFFSEHMYRNMPVLLEGQLADWQIGLPASEGGWLLADRSNVDISHLAARFGREEVTVSEAGRYVDMTVDEFATKWSAGETSYLKDWHAFLLPGTEHLAPTPELFADDWINSFLPFHNSADYRFVYLGRRGTHTNLHADVLNSYSWSANVCGCKRWLLLPPEQTHLLFDSFGHELAPRFHPIYERDFVDHDYSWVDRFPLLHRARPIEIIQGPGTTMFVPSGWHHTVCNLEDTLSVNANWCNATNLHWCCAELRRQQRGTARVRATTPKATGRVSDIASKSLLSPSNFLDMLAWKLEQQRDSNSPAALFDISQIILVAEQIAGDCNFEDQVRSRASDLVKSLKHEESD